MLRSKCPKCEGMYFEVALEEPENSRFKKYFVRCKSCKTVIGVQEYESTSYLIHKLAKKLNVNLDNPF